MVCSSSYLWHDREDEANLFNEFNIMKSCYAYDPNGVFDCMPSD